MGAILQILLTCGPMVLQIVLKMLPILYQLRILKTEAEVREWQRRFQEALKQAEKSGKDPIAAKDQYESAKKAAREEWDKIFGNNP